jgi:hypothetical protein
MIQKLLIVGLGLGILSAAACKDCEYINCEDCKYIDCAPGAQLSIEYRSQSDSTNLFTNGTYDIAALQAQQLIGPATIASDVRLFEVSAELPILIYWYNESLKGFVFSPDAGVSDTIWVRTEWGEETKCCGQELVLRQVAIGTDTFFYDQPNGGLITIYK